MPADEEYCPCYACEYDEGPAADVLGKGKTAFEKMKEVQYGLGGGTYSPFEDRDEWELVQWLINNVNQWATDEFLKLQVTRSHIGPSYRSNYTFMKIVDQLPTSPEWKYELVHTHGDVKDIGNDQGGNEDHTVTGEEMELWVHNLVTCIRELIGNPAFHGNIAYAPEKYDEMWTGDWWWEMQCHLPSGGTVAPVILVSDKTELSRFKGNKNAWPVYLSIRNLLKEVHHQPSHHTSILLGYLPVSKLESFDDNSVGQHHLFHYCMRRMVQPLVDAGRNGVGMVCADGQIWRVFPILATYIRDHPKQCLIACCAKNQCLKCLVPAKEQGINTPFQPCDQTHTTCMLHAQAARQYPPEFEGISKVKQWTGTDHKQVQHIFLAALVGAVPHPDVIKAGSNLLDFIYLAQYQSHTDHTLVALQQALDSFHVVKDIFIKLGCQEHFNMPKIHSLQHYMETIRSLGSLDGLNTETLEWLHINFAKKVYSASNQRDYLVQMTRWLQHQEAIIWFSLYLTWHHGNIQPVPQPTDDCDRSNKSDVLPKHPATLLNCTMLARPTKSFPAGFSYHILQQPQFPRRTVQYLQQKHGAVHFIHTLQDFFCSTLTDRHQSFQLNINNHFSCFSNIVIQLPPHEHCMVNRNLSARIHSHPQHDNGPHKSPTPARFDTILTLFDKELQQRGGFHGLHFAEICIIFKLPPHLGNYLHPLAYVHWFKLLTHFDRSVGMFCTTHSTQQCLPNAAIIPIHHLVQPCHLIPRFPNEAVNPHWTQGHAMTDANVFYLNKYIDSSIFDWYQNHF
ncbi:hypothetical protein BKA83DRAFT_4462512 [Pisolithus microcarpus]|nr:hypothetical protein BKA83DRAFT_4462512 [Pisolithus microcarpus]